MLMYGKTGPIISHTDRVAINFYSLGTRMLECYRATLQNKGTEDKKKATSQEGPVLNSIGLYILWHFTFFSCSFSLKALIKLHFQTQTELQ